MKKLILIIILFLALFLRFYKLGSYPALNADEAAIGYNAYSLIETGKDEHGNPWPIHFQSFNDYKPGLYFYIVLPFVKFFGLNEWSVRIPNAAIGVFTVYLIYLLVDKLLPNKKFSVFSSKISVGGVAAFMLAISPWHIHFSRGGWEVNVATFFMVLGLWLFLKGLSNPKYYTLCALSFVLSLYTYHAARIVVPFLGLGLIVIYLDEIKKKWKYFLLAGIIGLILAFPLIKDISRAEIRSRAAGVGLFADPGPTERTNEERSEHKNYNSFLPRLFHNKLINYGLSFAKNWTDHYHGLFLFISGDQIQRNRVPETGEMYLLDFLFIVIGLIVMVGNFSQNSKSNFLILWWLIVSPLAAALTFQSPHALRAQNMVIPLTIISAYGLVNIVLWLKTNINKKQFLIAGYLLLSALIFWQFARYEHMYFIHMAKEYPFSSQYGVKELAIYVKENQDKYQQIVVTSKYDQPYILFLFYLKYPPENFQKEHTLTARDKYGFSTVNGFGKYVFKKIDWDKDKLIYSNSLIAGADEEIPNETNIVKDIYGSNGYLYFKIVAN
jgi:4-amino-4-deoxy-L-arabinose transferase-like glycosyltransferase